MNELQRLQKAQTLLETVLDNMANLPKALDEWPKVEPENDKLLDTAWWQLIYLQNDSDIIQREPEYKERLLNDLKSICSKVNRRIENRVTHQADGNQ